jgi:hypothetical protein
MLTTIAATVAQNVILGWLWRRAQEIAGLTFAFIPIYLAMPPAMQEDVQAIFTGQGGGLTISAAFGILWYLWTQWQSYRATVAPQVVTGEGKKISIKPNTRAASAIEAEAIAAPKPKTLWERLTQR